MSEVWKDVVGFEGAYQVSDLGRVRSLTRTIVGSKPCQASRTIKGRLLKLNASSSVGYLMADLTAPGGVRQNSCVHDLVLRAFVGPRPEGMEGCHGDGNRRNPRLNNLRWDTHKANGADMSRHIKERRK